LKVPAAARTAPREKPGGAPCASARSEVRKGFVLTATIYDEIVAKKRKLAVVGLGYVGLPIAVEFAKHVDVIGFDVNAGKIAQLQSAIDVTGEVGGEGLQKTTAAFTADASRLAEASFIIVAVPTPVTPDHRPDLGAVESASRVIGENMSAGTIVVYESTVYPGVTEDVCVPLLAAASGLTCGVDFKVGYSPERINPADPEHRIHNITKVVSGMDDETLDTVASVYEIVVAAGVYRAESIKVAEAAKVIENAQRDINIAFMNELSKIFRLMDIDTRSVLRAAATKWNFLDFHPGIVGGHCIGVDPYYLTYRAKQLGYDSKIILAGRRINDGMGRYIAHRLMKVIMKNDIPARELKVAILGLAFKENCPDIRNTKVIDIIGELREYGVEPLVADPYVDAGAVLEEYGIAMTDMSAIADADVLLIAAAHTCFRNLTIEDVASFYRRGGDTPRILFDIFGIFDKNKYERAGYLYWRL
jgi:UDP-N-acetyl-D-galactosamine dehydrogenase